MSAPYIPHLPWEAAFLDALEKTKIIRRSARMAGITTGAIYSLRGRSEAFDQECKRLLRSDDGMKQALRSKDWKSTFLDTLAETSDVQASARRANINTCEAYSVRREDKGFAKQWQAALSEGYRNLEMEILCHLRDPKPERKMDVTNALRMLAVHKEKAAEEAAIRNHVSAVEVRASIERKVEALRERVAREKAQAAQ